MTTNEKWFFLIQQLISYPNELHHPKNESVREKLRNFLRNQTSCFLRAELLTTSQLVKDAAEGFRIHIAVDGIEDQYFEFLRKQNATYAFRSTVMFPKLTVEAVFNFRRMNNETKRRLDHNFNQAIEWLLIAQDL